MNMVQHKALMALLGGILFVCSSITELNVAEGADTVIPPKEQLSQLVNKTMLDFSIAIKARDFNGFYQNIAKFWQEQTTVEELYEIFRSFSDQNIDLTALQQYEPLFTQQPYLNDNGWLILQGNYPTRPLGVYFTLRYREEKSQWKLVGINVNVKTEEDDAKDIPSEDELKLLVKKTMLDFALAVKARDFTGFYYNISKVWQEQTTKEELYEIFRSFSEQDIDLTVLQDLDPIFTASPYFDEDGMLILQGRYLTQPSIVTFELAYIPENAEWKLFGINVNVKPEGDVEERLSHEELTNMVDATMLDFAQAVNTKNFTGFYQNLARLWQDQTTPEDLYQAFRTFSDQEIDLTVLQEYEPIFDKEPYFNESQWFIFEGHYPTEPSIVYFTLKYAKENGVWKLVGINVNIE